MLKMKQRGPGIGRSSASLLLGALLLCGLGCHKKAPVPPPPPAVTPAPAPQPPPAPMKPRN